MRKDKKRCETWEQWNEMKDELNELNEMYVKADSSRVVRNVEECQVEV